MLAWVTFRPAAQQPGRLGALLEERVLDLGAARAAQTGAHPHSPTGSMQDFLEAGPQAWLAMEQFVQESLQTGQLEPGSKLADYTYPLDKVQLQTPLPKPNSLRDFYAFERHVSTANANRGRSVPEEWYKFPVFYFTNHRSLFGPGETIPYPSYTHALDYELEVACVIGRPGMNIAPQEAENYIFGYTIMNDWSARDIQRMEMKVGLGPAKGKDFATSLGPGIVPLSALRERATGRPGVFDLQMEARLNGELLSAGNLKEIHYSFGELIARASQEVMLFPGDVIGTGTVGSGCLLELTKAQGPWLQPGDRVELSVERLGRLTNFVGEKQPKFQAETGLIAEVGNAEKH